MGHGSSSYNQGIGAMPQFWRDAGELATHHEAGAAASSSAFPSNTGAYPHAGPWRPRPMYDYYGVNYLDGYRPIEDDFEDDDYVEIF